MSESPGPAVLYASADGVATLTMNRPESLNALSEEMQDGLADSLSRAEADHDVVCVLFIGSFRFQAGCLLQQFVWAPQPYWR